MRELCSWWSFTKLIFIALSIKLGISHPLDLVQFLSHPDREIRFDAGEYLCIFGDEPVVASVFKALQKEPDPHVRKRLVWTLATAQAWDQLSGCLDSPHRDVRDQAAWSLTRGRKSGSFHPHSP